MKTQITDFTFEPKGYGRYLVTYISPVTGKHYYNSTTDMQLIDATKNSESPKLKDLLQLKRVCKR